jgi:Protein of unknown function (DUF3485)
MKSTTVSDVMDLPAKASGAKSSKASGPPSALAGEVTRRWSVVARALANASGSPWVWMGVTCLMLGISGGIRHWRGMQFYRHTEETRQCPFPLAELPKVLGRWHCDENSEAQLEPEIARIAGSSDHIIRNYTDNVTGESVSVLILYGLGQNVSFHSPEACYPAAGYTQAENGALADYNLKIPGMDKVARYRGGYFAKRRGGFTQFNEAAYSFRHSGEWVPDGRVLWKSFRYQPGMFKVQIGRVVSDFNLEKSTSVALLGEFMREIENRLDQIAASKTQVKGLEGKPGKKAS